MSSVVQRQADPLGQRQKLLIPESTHGSVASCLFERFNITTTSYHFLTCRFDLHLCDDTSNTPGDCVCASAFIIIILRGFQDVAFLLFQASFFTIFNDNCGSGEGLRINTCLSTMIGGRQGHAPVRYFCSNNACFYVS